MKYNLEKDLSIIKDYYPKLKYNKKGKNRYLTGYIDVFDADDNYCDSFEITIKIPNDYPKSFPKMFEIGGKINSIDNSHINRDGSCCVCSLQEEDIRLKRKSISIQEFIEEFAIPFLANIIYYKEKQKYANGEYKHGIDGVIQYYQELFGKENIKEVMAEISNTISVKKGRNDKCFCGSDLKYKRCHLKFKQKLEKLSTSRLLKDYELMLQITQKSDGNIK